MCVYVISGEAGNAARMMLILNMVQGSFMATIAEGLTLAQATGQSQQTFLDILCQGQMASTFVDQKCQSKSRIHWLLLSYYLLGRTHSRPFVLCPNMLHSQSLCILTSVSAPYHALPSRWHGWKKCVSAGSVAHA